MARWIRELGSRWRRFWRRLRGEMLLSPNWHFARDVLRLIWEYKFYSLAIVIVTIFQELAALWPVNLLGQFVDRLQTGELGHVVWVFFGASLLYPGIVRGNIILRHKMFYEADFQKRVEMILEEAERGVATDPEAAGSALTRVVNAVSGITNATYHVLGSFTPVIIKIIVVSGNLLAYNGMLGMVYLASLTVPALMTIFFNNKLRVLRDAQYSVVSRVTGAGVKAIVERENQDARSRFEQIMHERRRVLISLVTRSQLFLYSREVALVGGQFLTIFIALHLREQLHLTPGDFTKIVGYTTQVAAAFINTVAYLDAIISYSRAYHVFIQGRGSSTV